MGSRLPLIVGFGGFNASGRSSGHQGYMRTIYESLSHAEQHKTLTSLANLMGLEEWIPEQVLNGTLIRQIENRYFDVTFSPLCKIY